MKITNRIGAQPWWSSQTIQKVLDCLDRSPTPQLGLNWPSMGQISFSTQSLVGVKEISGTVWDLAEPKWLSSDNSYTDILLLQTQSGAVWHIKI